MASAYPDVIDALVTPELDNGQLYEEVTAQQNANQEEAECSPSIESGEQRSNNATSDGYEEPVIICQQGPTKPGDVPDKTKTGSPVKVNAIEKLKEPERSLEDSPYTVESPDVGSQEDEPNDEGSQDDEELRDEQTATIEEEYMQRILILEQRHVELEDVLTRLTAAVECTLAERVGKPPSSTADDDVASEATEMTSSDSTSDTSEMKETPEDEKALARRLNLELFVEFQQKIGQFGTDLNGVLNCAEAAIRHARVVQEWATSVQFTFEQIREEKQKMLNYIDDREKNMLTVKEQFIEELQEQGRQLQHIAEGLKAHEGLRERGEEYFRRTSVEIDDGRPLEESIIDTLVRSRMDEERSIILSLSKQSKISEMKLFIIHQQNCIQQLQEQNRELKAIIDGLMGPDDLEETMDEDTGHTSTPASSATPDRFPVKDWLEQEDGSLSLVSDVLYCDRSEYLPGTSTDGDVATVQTYGIGGSSSTVPPGDKIVFDPLTVDYVRDQCRQAEETERRVHQAENIKVDNDDDKSSGEDGSVDLDGIEKAVADDPDVDVIQDALDQLQVDAIQEALDKLTVEETEKKQLSETPVAADQETAVYDGAGDNTGLTNEKTSPKLPTTADDGDATPQTEIKPCPPSIEQTEETQIPVSSQ